MMAPMSVVGSYAPSATVRQRGRRILTAVAPRSHGVRLAAYAALSAFLIAAAWLVTYAAGGTTTAAPHAFYLGVVVAAVYLGLPGGLTAGVAAGIACGPLMPLDVEQGIAQATGNWLTRLAFFVVVGLAVGVAVRRLRKVWVREIEIGEQQHELDASKAALIESVSHEFRTPITVIEGVISTMRLKELIPPAQEPLLDSAERAAQRLWNLTSVTLAVSGAMGGADRRLVVGPVSVPDVINDLRAELKTRRATERLELLLRPECKIITSNTHLFRTVMFALLDNALRYSPDGSRVTVDVRRADDEVVIRVRDRGPGMPSDILDEATRAFTREITSETKGMGGLGLGLFTAHRVVGALDGTLHLERAHEGGTEAVVTLPQRRLVDRIAADRDRIAQAGTLEQTVRAARNT